LPGGIDSDGCADIISIAAKVRGVNER